ncbi:MAG TPA: hypothetical protein VKY36_07385 [Moheibacter sp.]|nr:hypothetical protein [Moheibacter sp.]
MNKLSEIVLFDLLKNDVKKRFFESNSASSPDISEWKGQDIVNFQEDVFAKTKSTVSEKWFYTYFKSDFKKLPRIDMLNLLSQYAGYTGWAEFLQFHQNNSIPAVHIEKSEEQETNSIPIPLKTENPEINSRNEVVKVAKKPPRRIFPMVLISLLILGLIAVGIYFGFFYQKTYEFCFVDSDRNSTITEPIEITIARKGFTPLELLTEKGCVEFSSTEDTLLMTIKSTYYKQDTFKINLHQYQGMETIRLEPDDYKVMLKHYSKSSQSVKERIKMLDEMIADDALIYQVYDNEYFGVEVLSKKQYINLVSLPTSSLKNFTLIEAERKSGKIVKIKFKIHSDEN